MRIAITDNMGSEQKLQKYFDWLKQGGEQIDIITLSYRNENIAELPRCGGLVLTGGNDVDPRLYGGDMINPKMKGVDPKRDDFERKAIDTAIRRGIPLLGICRGLQIVNVHFGGTLVEDLDEAGFQGHTSRGNIERRHAVSIETGSMMHHAAGVTVGEINSYHHQAADQPGPGLQITGRSPDGVTEAIEPAEKSIPSFLLLVQWHPERMKDLTNPFCSGVREEFFKAIQYTQSSQ